MSLNRMNVFKDKRSLLKEVIFALNGYSGDLFHVENAANDGKMRISSIVITDIIHSAHIDIFNKLCRIANCYSFINKFIMKNKTELCPYKRSFIKGIESIICTYHCDIKLINTLIKENENVSLTKFTIFFKYEQTFEMIIGLISEKKTSSSISDTLEEFSLFGWKNVQKSAQIILSHSDSLYYDIWFWIIFGYLNDQKCNHFFVRDENGDPKLDFSRIPKYIDSSIASKICFIGQNVRFALQRDVTVFKEKELEMFNLFMNVKRDKFGFNCFIENVRSVVSEHSWNYITIEEHLIDHLKTLKDFYLTGKDQFWSTFVSNLSDKIFNGHKVSQREIQRSFESSLRCSFDETEAEKILELITLNCEAKDNFEISLDYKIPSSLKCVILSESFEKYNYILNFMLKLYAARIKLHKSWFCFIKIKSSALNSSNTSKYWYMLHQRLASIIEILYYYFKVDVIELLFDDFIRKMQLKKEYETIQKEHQKFISDLFVHSFLKMSSVQKCIYQIFEICFQMGTYSVNEDSLQQWLKSYDQTSKQLYHLLVNIESRKINPTVAHLLLQIDKCAH